LFRGGRPAWHPGPSPAKLSSQSPDSTWPLTGGHAIRPPLLQPDPDLHEADVVGEYQRALASGDVEGAVTAFEPNATVREPAGGHYVHRGTEELRRLYTLFFSNGGGIPLEHCAATDD